MLQNSQLTNELDFQSGKADKSLNKNKGLQERIYNTQRDIDIHKEVENELAKRAKSYFKVYKDKHSKTKILEKEYNDQMMLKNDDEMEDKIKELEENIFYVEENLDKNTVHFNQLNVQKDKLSME